MPRPDRSSLVDILVAARKIREIGAGLSREAFEADELRVLSVERLITILGEAAKQVSPDFRSRNPEIPWRQMAGMRDILIHAYDAVDQEELWKAITTSVPALISRLEPLIPPVDDGT